MQSQRHYKQTVLQLALDCQGRSGERRWMQGTAYRCTGVRATVSILSTSISTSLHLTLCTVPMKKEDAAKIVDSVKKKKSIQIWRNINTSESSYLMRPVISVVCSFFLSSLPPSLPPLSFSPSFLPSSLPFFSIQTTEINTPLKRQVRREKQL